MWLEWAYLGRLKAHWLEVKNCRATLIVAIVDCRLVNDYCSN